MELKDIQSTVQQIAEAISSVIEMNVTVTDRSLVRIAGTGKYKAQIGEKDLPERRLCQLPQGQFGIVEEKTQRN